MINKKELNHHRRDRKCFSSAEKGPELHLLNRSIRLQASITKEKENEGIIYALVSERIWGILAEMSSGSSCTFSSHVA